MTGPIEGNVTSDPDPPTGADGPVVVIGAGITGLTVTHELAQRGVDVLTFEADAEPGGVIRSGTVDGHVLDWGPQRIRRTPAVDRLIEALDLEGAVLTGDSDAPLFVAVDGELCRVPKSIGTFLRTDALSWRGKARVLREPLTDPARGDELVADLLRRKFGHEAAENVLEPLIGGIYAGDPAAMPADPAVRSLLALEERHGSLLRAALSRIRGGGETPPPITFGEGLQQLPRALYERHEPYVHLETPVSAVEPGEDGSGYRVRVGGRPIEAAAVVVTVPARDAAGLLDSLAADGLATIEPLRDLSYNSLVLVHLAADVDVTGFGYQLRRAEGFSTRGVTWNGGLFDRDGLFTAFLGGASDPGAVERDADTLARTASEEFETVMGVAPNVLSVRSLPEVVPAYDTSWRGLGDLRLPDGIHLATNYTGRIGVPSRVREGRQVAERLASER